MALLRVARQVVNGSTPPRAQDDAVVIHLLGCPASALIMRKEPNVVSATAGIPVGVVGANPVEGMPVHRDTPLHTVVPALCENRPEGAMVSTGRGLFK